MHRPLLLLLLLLLLLWLVLLQVHQLSDVEQKQLEADQAAAVEREDFEAAAVVDEQLQVNETDHWSDIFRISPARCGA